MTFPIQKKALLVVSFGTSYADTRKKNIEHLQTLLADAFPDRAFYYAYTSGMIIKKLRQESNIYIPSVKEAMDAIKKDGITDLLVQPTHIINGVENDIMKEEIQRELPFFTSIRFGTPLLTTTEDQFQVIDALLAELPSLTDKDALLFMGHGSSHYGNAVYAALDYAFKQKSGPNIHVGTVEAYPTLDTVLTQLKRTTVTHIYITPLMLVAGDHATNDLAGASQMSWNSILKAHGYTTTIILKGLGEYKAVTDLYIAHAHSALS